MTCSEVWEKFDLYYGKLNSKEAAASLVLAEILGEALPNLDHYIARGIQEGIKDGVNCSVSIENQ